MLKSMTGFGRSLKETSFGRLLCEIHSVNRKFLEIHLSLPPEFSFLDKDIRKWVSSLIERGAVSVKFHFYFDKKSPVKISVNKPLAIEMKKALQELANEVGIPLEKSFNELLLQQNNLLAYENDVKDENAYLAEVKEVFDKAFFDFIKIKEEEGKAIFNDINRRALILEKKIKEIAALSPQSSNKYKLKLQERLKDYLSGDSIDQDERLLKEIAIFAEKVDVSEELTLFQAHLVKFFNLIQSDNNAVAKTLEFLLQELNREINTIGSKSVELAISSLVIEIKSELEKIREIIQNVE